MRRVHLFEFEDQPWFSDRLRVAMTAYLAATYRITPFPKLWAHRIASLLEACRLEEIVDLGSGSAGPLPLVAAELEKLDRPVRVPARLTGLRTMFASFHQFRPQAARSILRDAFEQRRPICIFEAASRTPAATASLLVIPLLALTLTPTASLPPDSNRPSIVGIPDRCACQGSPPRFLT